MELFALHVYFICVGLNCQRNIGRTHSVIRDLDNDRTISIFIIYAMQTIIIAF